MVKSVMTDSGGGKGQMLVLEEICDSFGWLVREFRSMEGQAHLHRANAFLARILQVAINDRFEKFAMSLSEGESGGRQAGQISGVHTISVGHWRAVVAAPHGEKAGGCRRQWR